MKNWKLRVCDVFCFICKISNFKMWTAKHLAQASCTELTVCIGGVRGVILYYIQNSLDFVNLDWQVVKYAVLKCLKRLFWTLPCLNCKNEKALCKGWVLAWRLDASYYANVLSKRSYVHYCQPVSQRLALLNW